MIPDDVVARVRDEADIVAIVGEFVKLKRVGNSFRGPCPFHHGKKDNFSVTARGGYKCFRCGEAGDVFTFAQKHLGLEFVDAVKWVGGKAGIEVHETLRRADTDAREPFWEVNASAVEFFRSQLRESPGGAGAREYLAGRGLSRDAADRFSIGYAPRDASAMIDALAALGFDRDRQLAAGLTVVREERPDPRPRFRDRVMFPIFDAGGHPVGFGGRVLGTGEPKYLNSPDSSIFAKRSLLYGLNWAKQSIRKADRLIIVEGYVDAIRLMLAGIGEVVAPLGTALTEQQAELIRKYTKHVFLLYDSDQAGLKATFRAGDALVANGISVRVISLPEGDDPDTFVAREGAAGFEQAAAASVDVFDRKIQILERGGWFSDLRRKREAIDRLLPTIRLATDPITRDMYVTRTSEVAGVSREMLIGELAGGGGGRARAGGGDARGAPSRARPETETATPGSGRRARSANGRAERELVRMLLHQRQFIEPTAERIGPANFTDGAARAIFMGLTTHAADVAVDELAASLDDDATVVLQELLNETGGIDRTQETIDAGVKALLSRAIDVRLLEIDRILPLAPSAEQDDLLVEKARLRAEITALGQPRWKNFGRGAS